MSLSTFGRNALLAAVLVLSACSKKEPDRWTEAEKAVASATTTTATAAAKPDTGSFNAFFPAEGTEGLKRFFSADKPGYAEAVYGDEVLAISITVADDAAKKKFADSKETLKSYPLSTFGKNQTMVLVGGKYQVKVSSKRLDDGERRKWLERVNLTGVAGVTTP